jgi:hypothetical protein
MNVCMFVLYLLYVYLKYTAYMKMKFFLNYFLITSLQIFRKSDIEPIINYAVER